jgi:CRISPR-associated protein (TIGR03986 family)
LPERVLFVDAGFATLRKGDHDEWVLDDQAWVKPWECQDRFLPGTLSGWIDVELKTLTPLFIRGAVRHGQGADESRESRLRPEPYTTPDGRPAIPGSSLRGMVRNLVEILSFSKVQPVPKERLFFRTVSDDALGRAYRHLIMQSGGPPDGGFLRRNGDRWEIERASAILRVSRNLIPGVPRTAGPSYHPTTDHGGLQAAPCWIQRSPGDDRVTRIVTDKANRGTEAWEEGVLWLTGNAPRKAHEFVLLRSASPASLPIPDTVWREFCSAEQVSGWQERNFPKDWPSPGSRKEDGQPAEGDAVFFNESDGQATGLGRARMFRIAYDLSPEDLIPDDLKSAKVDFAEALFGRVDDKPGSPSSDSGTFSGRVRFADAEAVGPAGTPDGGTPQWFEDPVVPRNLASPKPTAFQHYLVQTIPDIPGGLKTYLAEHSEQTELRGHKLYWHRWDEGAGLEQALWREPKEDTFDRNAYDARRKALLQAAGIDQPLHGAAPKVDKQLTLICPVRANVTFKARIAFDNLAPVELGALLAALRLPKDCAHKIGMGKPLGLGSIAITANVFFVDRAARYAGWASPVETPDHALDMIASRTFENLILDHAKATDEPMREESGPLQKIDRLAALFLILGWENRKPPAETRNLKIENGSAPYPPDNRMRINEFRTRPVLPTPQRLFGLPTATSSAPRPAEGGAPTRRISQVRTAAVQPFSPSGASVREGAVVNGTILPRDLWTKKSGKPRFQVDGTAFEGMLHPSSPEVPDPQPGAKVKLLVKKATKNPKLNEFVFEP